MNTHSDKTTNTFTRSMVLAVLAGGLALLAYAANETTPQVAPAASNKPATASPSPVSGELMAHTCAACHGTQGRLGDESFMPLAGMPLRQFTTSMVDFREGTRPATLMGHVAQGFSDAEIRAMGEYFAAVKPEGSQP
jgi:cytochrome subunit of sulfide dehydrogenase